MPNWTETAPVVDLVCPLCETTQKTRRIVDAVWEAPRSAVYQCSHCAVVFVHPIMSIEEEREFYKDGFTHYMKVRGGPGETEAQAHFRENQSEGARRLDALKPFLRPDMHVLEIGSSTGFLLDAVRPFVASVTGIEPGNDYRAYANDCGIPTLRDVQDVAGKQYDLVLSYYVVEHLRDPIGQLRAWRELLRDGGRLAVEVPNVEDALVKFYQLDAFDQFYWQKAHYFNYSHETLSMVARRAGFKDIQAIPDQRYDISNHIHWLRTGKPGGKGKYTEVLDEKLNAEYQRCLKERWLCDTVFLVASK